MPVRTFAALVLAVIAAAALTVFCALNTGVPLAIVSLICAIAAALLRFGPSSR